LAAASAAFAAARHGAKTTLVQNRPVLDGNASSEIRINIEGAAVHADRVRLTMKETYGEPRAWVFEVRVYA